MDTRPTESATRWRILDTDFGTGQHFLAAWHAWKTSPDHAQRLPFLPILHYCAITAQPPSAAALLNSTASSPELIALAATLAAQWHGLQPGFHRISLDDGHVLLTLCVGELKAMLRELAFTADSVVLAGSSERWDIHTVKAIARCCHRGTRTTATHLTEPMQQALAQCGFVQDTLHGLDDTSSAASSTTKRTNRTAYSATYNPHWEPKNRQADPQRLPPGTCTVIGAGLAGAAVANSLARRGWRVTVLDAATEPAQGASGIPAGLVVPHVSPDDSLLSRLSRSGVRITVQQAQALLVEGEDWALSGVLEHRVDGSPGLPSRVDADSETSAAPDTAWSRPATAAQLSAAQLAPDTLAVWHSHAAWVKPAALVAGLLRHPNITWRGSSRVHALQRIPADSPGGAAWLALDETGATLARAQLTVVAAAYASEHLLQAKTALPLQAIRGQISWGLHPQQATPNAAPAAALPPFPVNGQGSVIPQIPTAQGMAWAVGATFERDQSDTHSETQATARRHAENQARLHQLLSRSSPDLATQFTLDPPSTQAFIGIRCASPDRLPLVGTLPATEDLWISTAMGSRGLSLALLCAELLAARLHSEPWPVEKRLAQALDAQRFAVNPPAHKPWVKPLG